MEELDRTKSALDFKTRVDLVPIDALDKLSRKLTLLHSNYFWLQTPVFSSVPADSRFRPNLESKYDPQKG